MKFASTILIAGLVAAGPSLADPPAHAPAHGYHKHKDRHGDHDRHKPGHARHKGKSGVVYASDYGIASGRCNRNEIGAVIGGVSGAVIGGTVTDREDRVVGMVVGGVVGAILGHAIGDRMDDRDRACMGHALDLGKAGAPVVWTHSNTRYRFVPGRDARDGCRYATLSVDGKKPREVLACPAGRGDWTFRRT